LSDLSRLVRTSRADVGFGLDPDGDRLAIVDETGQVLDPDDVLALAVDIVLRRQKGNVVVNLTTSSAIDDIAKGHGCRVWRSPVGEANVVGLMQARNAVIGGEGSSGGIIFPSIHLCRDSFSGIALLLDAMAETGWTVSQLAAGLPQYYRRNGKRQFEHGVLGQVMQSLEEGFPGAQIDRSDGLKLLFPDGWVHVRASNTEPLVRIAAEANSNSRLDDLWHRAVDLLP
jgi:phosphomannomutase